MNTREILSHIPDLRHLDSGMFLLMAGPCVVENETMLRQVAETACRITERLRIPYIFKASYRKANRSRIDSFSGIGDPEALRMLEDGASVGKVYRRYFLGGGDETEQTEANLGLGMPRGERLTAEEIERISRLVDRNGRYALD